VYQLGRGGANLFCEHDLEPWTECDCQRRRSVAVSHASALEHSGSCPSWSCRGAAGVIEDVGNNPVLWEILIVTELTFSDVPG